ncbi:MAG: methyltransferase [Friedmanniella sp.]|nr:methyltransferase [Friedmanniella sp.]
MTAMLTDWSGLADLFETHDYTVDAVVELIGEQAHRAMGRNATVAAVRALGDRTDPLATLTRLWPLQRVVDRDALERALPGLVDPLVADGILTAVDHQILAAVDIRPYASDDGASGWVVSDLSPGLDTVTAPMRPDFVLGVSSASATLTQLTVRTPVRRALDLGTGCGVQSLHLSRHADEVMATDLNPRALELAELTARLNGVTIDLRLGSLYEPVGEETFDLIVSNPPYVMSPPGDEAERLTYREGNSAADGLVEQVVTGGAARLNPGGVLQVLGNWAHVRGQDWRDRIGGWVAGTGCDVHVVQREVLDPYEYIELWLADAGLAGSPLYPARYAAWCDYFEALEIEAVGMGWLVLRRTDRAVPHLVLEDWPHPLEQPIAPALEAELVAVDLLAGLDDRAVLARTWTLAPDVVEETQGTPGLADPQHLVYRQQRGFRRAVQLDTAMAGVLGACDGELRLDQIVASVARLLDVDPATLAAQAVTRVRDLARDGLLLAADPAR